MSETIMPLQPIKDGRFIENRIVRKLLDVAPIDLNDIACMDFTDQERMQLIGYSLNGFAELSYVDDETYDAACLGKNETEARNEALREKLETVKKGLREASSALFEMHPDDFGG